MNEIFENIGKSFNDFSQDADSFIKEQKAIKSESFNRTTIVTKRTKEIVGGLLLEKALSIAPNYWQHVELNELSKVALNLGLLDVADKIIEMS